MAIANILLVDDDDTLRGVVRATLEMEDYEIVEAPSCRTALAMLGKQSFDLVLLDIHLPDGSGLRVLEAVSERRPSTIVMMMTGAVGLDNALKSIKLGASDYITKPFSSNYLLKAIEHALLTKDTKEGLRHS